MISSQQKAYLAGFLDGDGSIYVRAKPNNEYRYRFQIAPYIVLFQSSKNHLLFKKLCALIPFGIMRERKDGVLEYSINRVNDLIQFLEFVEPYVILKKAQVILMKKILAQKLRINSKRDFQKLMDLVAKFEQLNYSKKRKKHTLTL